MSSSKYKKSKELRKAEQQVEAKPRELTPTEMRRQRMINAGVIVLVVAFMMTSGIVCTDLGANEPQNQPAQTEQQNPVDELERDIERWSKELATNPNDPTALSNIGYSYNRKASSLFDEKDADKRTEALGLARQHLEKAIEADDKFMFAYEQLALTLHMEGKPGEARTLLEGALEKVQPEEGADEARQAELDSKRAQILLRLSELDLDDKKPEDALAKLDQAQEIKPGEAEIYLNRAIAYAEMGNREEAEKNLDLALDIATKMRDRDTLFKVNLIRQKYYPAPVPEATPALESTPSAPATPTAEATPAAPTPEATP